MFLWALLFDQPVKPPLSPAQLAFQVPGPVRILGEDASQIGDGRDGHGHHPLDVHQRLLFCSQLVVE